MADKEGIGVIYLSNSAEKPRDAKFWALLTFVKKARFKYTLFTLNLKEIQSIVPEEFYKKIN